MRARSLVPALLLSLVVAATATTLTGCGMVTHTLRHGSSTPPASEFGFGPRTSAAGRYVATLTPGAPLKVGPLQTVRISLREAAGAPVRGASITLDGGMPQHGHGLPTRPRVTAEEDGGVYVVDGLRFNMGGWWDLRFTVATAAGTDVVTFNVRL